ncbi:MAG: carboxylesterase family protein, partial [Pseudomonadales bacterium]|nr:carboxylesterase family protein [Pseudomonadales bacterium]
LYLNIWTAAESADKRRPVMVWIHPGALRQGSGSVPQFDGAELARKGAMVLTFNFRFGRFGFLALPELSKEDAHDSSGNYGMLDQIAALEWVQRNISKFGGDPDMVTIFGESSGSYCVHWLMCSPLGKGLFHRAIGQSGAASGDSTRLRESRHGQRSAEEIGLAFAEACGADSVAALRELSSDRILDVVTHAPQGSQLTTTVNVDGWFLEAPVREVFAQGKQNDVPLIVGSNRDEAWPGITIPKTLEEYRQRVTSKFGDKVDEFDTLYPVETMADIRDALIWSATDAGVGLRMRTWAKAALSKGKSNVYVYYFTRVAPTPGSEYAGHTREILYAFNNLPQRFGEYEEVDYKLADIISDYWVNFAATGDPNSQGLPDWTPSNGADEAIMVFGDSVETRIRLLSDKYDFFE